jgi:hypothetical protein
MVSNGAVDNQETDLRAKEDFVLQAFSLKVDAQGDVTVRAKANQGSKRYWVSNAPQKPAAAV